MLPRTRRAGRRVVADDRFGARWAIIAATMDPHSDPREGEDAASPYKSRGGAARLWQALRYSFAGLRAAVRHEAAFRQELLLGVPLLLLVPWLAPGRWQALLMCGSIVAVWVVELLNSGLEALADALSIEAHPLLGRAKDLGSAAVMLTLFFAALVWAVVLWPAAALPA